MYTSLEAKQQRRSVWGRVGGQYLAGPATFLAAMPALLIEGLFGEGDYLIIVLGAIWAAVVVGADRLRRRSELNSMRRSFALWLSIYGAFLSISMFAAALAFALGGSWR